MRFFTVSAALAFAASAVAQTPDFNPVYTPEKGEEVDAGSTFEVTWQAPPKYKDETVSISLTGGADPASLVPISDIVGGIQNSKESYQWTVDASLGAEATYGLVFKLESNPEIFQYSFPFKIAKGKGGDEPEEPEQPGKPTHIVETAIGTKTLTLTSCPPTSEPVVTSTFAPNTTTSTWSTSTKQWNTTTTINTPLPPPATTDIVIPTPEPTVPVPPPSSTPSEVPEGAGARAVAGPVALFGGLAIALFAM